MTQQEAKALIKDFRPRAASNPNLIEKGYIGHGKAAEAYEMYVFGKKIKLKVNNWMLLEELL